jgi:hypothetical protein
MAKIVKLNKKPVVISGYLVTDGNKEKDTIRLYPRLDPGQYYAFDKECVVGTLSSEDDEEEFVTLLLDPDCEIEVVCRERIEAKELIKKKQKSPCGCADETEAPDVIKKEDKEDLKDTVISVAELLVSVGITELNCAALDSLTAGCCQAWNRLLGAVNSGGNTSNAANTVMLYCYGVA